MHALVFVLEYMYMNEYIYSSHFIYIYILEHLIDTMLILGHLIDK